METGDWERLNAYADGELPEAEAHLVKERLAADAKLREGLQDIRELKRNLARMRPPIGNRGSDALPRRGGFGSKAAIAAGVALALMIGAGAYLHYPQPTSWLAHARSLHADQSHKAYVVKEEYVAQTVSSGQALDFRTPDLTASRLYLVDIVASRWDDRETIAMHYRGVHGCRLTIVAVEANGDAALGASAGDALTRTWTHQGFLFAAIAEGMDAERFATAADYARSLIVEPSRSDDDMLIAMAETQRTAQPCA